MTASSNEHSVTETAPELEVQPAAAVTALIGHADRVWKAAETNATRLAARSGFMASTATGVLGLVFYAVGRQSDLFLDAWDYTPGLLSLFCLCLLVIVAFYGTTLWLVLGGSGKVRKPAANGESDAQNPGDSESVPHVLASSNLALPLGVGDQPWGASPQIALWAVYLVTYAGARDLEHRNVRRKRTLDVASRSMLYGLAVVLSLWIQSIAIAYNVRAEKERIANDPAQQSKQADQLKP